MNVIKQILENSFYQLVFVYSVLVLFISFNLIFKYSYHMEIYAFILAVLAIFSLNANIDLKEQEKHNQYLYYFFLLHALIIIFFFRAIPYKNNTIPLGYDAGIYKYIIEHGTNYDRWLVSSTEPGFFYFMQIIKEFLSTDFILTYLLIIFNVIVGISIYLTAKEFFNKKIALLSTIIYSLSSIQFLAFSYMYYKNIIALSLVLFSILFLKKSEKNSKFIILFILFSVLTGIFHRPTFYILGLSYFFYAFVSPIDFSNKKYNAKSLIINIIYGIIILILTLFFYIGRFSPAILTMIEPVTQGFFQPGESPGTFINFLTYQFSTLAYLPFALIGFFYLIRKRQFDMLFFWALLTLIIVYFQFFFFNRFIIHLDIVLILLSGIGFYMITENKKKVGVSVLIIMIIASAYIAYTEALNTKTLINAQELETIKQLQQTEENSFVMTTSSIYSPWVLGYSNRKTIAPGLFDYNVHNKQQWNEFWKTNNLTYIKEIMNAYKKPLYIFIGEKQGDNLKNYPDCFKIYYTKLNNTIYTYTC